MDHIAMTRRTIINGLVWSLTVLVVLVALILSIGEWKAMGQSIMPLTPTETPLHAAQASALLLVVPTPQPPPSLVWQGNANVTAWGVDESSNLLDWQSFAVVAGVNGQITYQLTASQAQMFFRVWPLCEYNPQKQR